MADDFGDENFGIEEDNYVQEAGDVIIGFDAGNTAAEAGADAAAAIDDEHTAAGDVDGPCGIHGDEPKQGLQQQEAPDGDVKAATLQQQQQQQADAQQQQQEEDNLLSGLEDLDGPEEPPAAPTPAAQPQRQQPAQPPAQPQRQEQQRQEQGSADARGGWGRAGGARGARAPRSPPPPPRHANGDAAGAGGGAKAAPETRAAAAGSGEERPPHVNNTVLYICNLPWWATDAELDAAVAEFGPLVGGGVRFIEERVSGRSRGVAVVEFESPESAAECKAKLAGREIQGRPVVVTWVAPPGMARPLMPAPGMARGSALGAPPGGGGGRGGGGGGGRGQGMHGPHGMPPAGMQPPFGLGGMMPGMPPGMPQQQMQVMMPPPFGPMVGMMGMPGPQQQMMPGGMMGMARPPQPMMPGGMPGMMAVRPMVGADQSGAKRQRMG